MADVDEGRVSEEASRLLDEFYARLRAPAESPLAFTPRVELREAADHYLVRVELPGVQPRDVEVAVEGAVLFVRGQRRPPAGVYPGYEYTELPYGQFARELPLPGAADTERARAELRDGILEVRLPRRAAVRAAGASGAARAAR